MDVVAADVPPLLGLGLMDRHSLTPDTVTNRLAKRIQVKRDKSMGEYIVDDWHVPMLCYSGHIYLEISLP